MFMQNCCPLYLLLFVENNNSQISLHRRVGDCGIFVAPSCFRFSILKDELCAGQETNIVVLLFNLLVLFYFFLIQNETQAKSKILWLVLVSLPVCMKFKLVNVTKSLC